MAQLVGVDVGFHSLLRRLGPAWFRSRPTPDKVIDWASIASFGSQHGPGGTLQASGQGLQRLRPGELADLLEDLGRAERRGLLAQLPPERAADALEEMQQEELVRLLRESGTADAAALLSRTKPSTGCASWIPASKGSCSPRCPPMPAAGWRRCWPTASGPLAGS
ncbi:MAG TPA: hypothetical protein VN714_06965 [Trebonia sp.]|nr:hypothetical protein [Trebonia sp.]